MCLRLETVQDQWGEGCMSMVAVVCSKSILNLGCFASCTPFSKKPIGRTGL